MRRSTILVTASLACLSAPGALAQPTAATAPTGPLERARSTGIEIDYRMGYGLPAGQATEGADGALSNRFTGMLPLIFGLGYRVHPRVSVGGYFQYGIGFTNDRGLHGFCSRPGYSCPSSVVRWGGDVRFRLLPRWRLDPWLGVGMGYEEGSTHIHPSNDESASLSDVRVTVSGLEYAHLEAGADYRLFGNLAVGAFATMTVAHYSHETITRAEPGSPPPTSIPGRSVHEWMLLGVRLSYLWEL